MSFGSMPCAEHRYPWIGEEQHPKDDENPPEKKVHDCRKRRNETANCTQDRTRDDNCARHEGSALHWAATMPLPAYYVANNSLDHISFSQPCYPARSIARPHLTSGDTNVDTAGSGPRSFALSRFVAVCSGVAIESSRPILPPGNTPSIGIRTAVVSISPMPLAGRRQAPTARVLAGPARLRCVSRLILQRLTRPKSLFMTRSCKERQRG